jgi:hypothetical protein
MLLGTGYALYRHGQDRLALQIAAGVRTALNDWEPPLPAEQGPAAEVGWGVAPVELDSLEAPREWDDFIGQDHLRERFEVRLASARERRGRLPHTLLVSEQSGMGKRHLARLLANLAGSDSSSSWRRSRPRGSRRRSDSWITRTSCSSMTSTGPAGWGRPH